MWVEKGDILLVHKYIYFQMKMKVDILNFIISLCCIYLRTSFYLLTSRPRHIRFYSSAEFCLQLSSVCMLARML